MIRQIAKANAILVLQYAVAGLVPLLLVPHIVRVIGLTEYGHLAVLMAWGGYGSLVVQYAFQLTGPKRIMQRAEGESIASIFIDITFAKLLLLFIVLLAAAILSFAFLPFDSNGMFSWLIIFAMPISVFLNSTWLLQSQDKFFPVCILAITGTLLTLGIGFYFIDGTNPWAVDVAVLVSLLGSVFVGAGTLILSIRSIGQIEYLLSLKRIFSMLKDGWHLFASQFTSMLYTGSGPIVINYLLDAKAAGSYSITDRVVSTIMAAALLSHTAAYPRLAAAYLENKTIYFRTLKLVVFGYLAVTIMVAVFGWMMREEIIQYLFGSEASGEHLNLLYFGLMWLVLGIFGTALTGYLTISGRGKYVWPLTVKVLVFSVVTAVPGIWLLGSSGWLAALVLSQSLVLYTGFKYWKVESGK